MPAEVFALSFFGGDPIPLILIAIMTFILITSSGTMALAVNYGYRKDKRMAAILMMVTAAFGASFVGMQAFEWTKLITEGVRPWGNPGCATIRFRIFYGNRFSRPARHRRGDLSVNRRQKGGERALRQERF